MLHHMQINIEGSPDSHLSLAAILLDCVDAQLTLGRLATCGRLHFGIGCSYVDNEVATCDSFDAAGFICWSTR